MHGVRAVAAMTPPVLIGGCPRVGKSTVSRRLHMLRSGEFVHLDHLSDALAAVATGEEHAALVARLSNTTTLAEWIATSRRRDGVLFAGVRAYLDARTGDEPLLMEGVLWPDQVATLSVPHTAAFLVDLSGDVDRIAAIAASDPNSWLARRGYSGAKLRRWVEGNTERSRMMADQAREHGYPCFDVGQGIDAAHAQLLETLAP